MNVCPNFIIQDVNNMNMVTKSTRTINRERKIEMLKEALNICLDMLLMEKRQVEAGNMAKYKRMLSELKEIKVDAERVGKPLNQDGEILAD